MEKKTQLMVMQENKPGTLARLTGVLAKAKVNLEAITLNDGVHHGVVKLVPANPVAAAKALKKAGILFSEQKVYALSLQNKAGALADACAKLAKAGVNIDYLYGSTCLCDESCPCTCMLIVSLEDGKAARAALDRPKKKGKK